jgi:hypothetical protein
MRAASGISFIFARTSSTGWPVRSIVRLTAIRVEPEGGGVGVKIRRLIASSGLMLRLQLSQRTCGNLIQALLLFRPLGELLWRWHQKAMALCNDGIRHGMVLSVRLAIHISAN